MNETASSSGGVYDVSMTNQALTAGTYTVVVSAIFAKQDGAYTLSLAQVPAPITVLTGDEGGTLTNGVATTGTIALGDLDIWSFTANAGDGLMLRMGAPAF